MSVEADDIITYLVVKYNAETSAAAADCVMHRNGLHATVIFILDGRGDRVITIILKTAKFRCDYYCTGNHSTPCVHTGTRVLGAEEMRFLKAPWLLTIPRGFSMWFM